MNQTISPAELLLLIHIYAIPGVHQSTPVNDVAIKKWLAEGVITASEKKGEYRTTSKGSRWIQMICETPQPVNLWCDPRDKT